MAEYKVKITKTQICEIILKAEDDADLQEVVDEAMSSGAFNFDNQEPKYNVEVNELGREN